MKYKNSVFAQLGTAKSQDSFEVSSTYKNGFTVSPYIPSSPLATSRSFSKAPILKEPSIVPVNQQKFSPFSKRNYEDRIRDALSKIPATPLYNKIKQERQLKLDGLKKKIEESTKPKLPTLPGDASKRLSEARGRPESFTIVEIFNIPIGSKEMKKLVSPNWLNDEIINAYFEMIQARSNSDDHRNLPKVHVFSTHFYSTIMERGYEGVQRWTRKVDIFAKDLILIPVHLGMHWVLAVIDFRLKMVRYIDSLHGSNPKALNVFKMYLESEHQSKKGFPFDAADWTFESVTNCPAQRNGYDCGVFTCVNAEYISRNASLSYSQNDMLYFRDKIGYELLTQNFLE